MKRVTIEAFRNVHACTVGPLLSSIMILAVGCHVQLPIPHFRVTGRAAARADIRIEAQARVDLRMNVRARTLGQFQIPTSTGPRPVVVPLEGSSVVEFFGVPLDGAKDVIFVLDRSGSMTEPARGRIAELSAAKIEKTEVTTAAPVAGGPEQNTPETPVSPDPSAVPEPAAIVQPPSKIEVARLELIDALTRLPAETRVNVLFFSDWLEVHAPSWTVLDPTGREHLIEFVHGIEPSGSTALATAMRAAFVMGARHVVLLSDGLGNIGGGVREVLRDAREAIRGGVRIDTIGLGQHQEQQLMRALADESGGVYQAL